MSKESESQQNARQGSGASGPDAQHRSQSPGHRRWSRRMRRQGGGGQGGLDALIRMTSRDCADAFDQGQRHADVILRLAADLAYIRLQDMGRPLHFLRQMAGAPPLTLGVEGFRADLVDDQNPARHYFAFVFIGYWLPWWPAVGVLWAWEMAGFVRYGGTWSPADMRSGYVGIRHGGLARRYGVTVLPALMASELSEREEQTSPDAPMVSS